MDQAEMIEGRSNKPCNDWPSQTLIVWLGAQIIMDVGRMIKDIAKTTLHSIGLEGPALRVWSKLRSRGWTPWTPLVPAESYSSCLRDALDRLQAVTGEPPRGAYVEFGVSRGTSLTCAFHVVQEAGYGDMRLIGFDSFEGLPPSAAEEGWHPGDFCSSITATRRYLDKNGVDLDRVTLVKGWFEETLTDDTRSLYDLGPMSVIMIDCDLFSATEQVLRFCAPHIGSHAVIIFDDWGWRSDTGDIGEKEAFEAFLQANPSLRADPLPAYRPEARIFLLTRG